MLISVAVVSCGNTTISTVDRDTQKNYFCGLECWEPFKLCLSKGNETNKNTTGMVKLICEMKSQICRANCSVRLRKKKIETSVFTIKKFCEEKCIDFKASCLTYAKMKRNFQKSVEETWCNGRGVECTSKCYNVQDRYKTDMHEIIMKYNEIIAKKTLRRQLRHYVRCQKKCSDGFLVCTNLLFAKLSSHQNLSYGIKACFDQRVLCGTSCIVHQIERRKLY